MATMAGKDGDGRRRWASPASAHDRHVRWAMIGLPSAIGALAALLVIAPALSRNEISFTLAKDKVEKAGERLRASRAEYRGEDDKGRAFQLTAGEAVQATSATPIVALSDLAAQITLDGGPTRLTAPRANYNMEQDRIDVPGPLLLRSDDGYTLNTANVGIDLRTRRMASDARVTGTTQLGSFSAGRMRADLDARTVTLEGGARLHIVQGTARAK